jgi:predicted 3-demethylubiquinone-9 3-methyltransferase (glyoxalase superfamily)
MTNQLYPCLWFDNQAKEAAEFYCSFFPNSKIVSENPIVVIFELNHTKFMGLNGGPIFKHSEAVSFVVECKDQEEIDYYWNHFIADGGNESQCGWCKDKFGVSWQVIPTILGELMNDPAKSQRVMEAFMKMKKFDIELLKNA